MYAEIWKEIPRVHTFLKSPATHKERDLSDEHLTGETWILPPICLLMIYIIFGSKKITLTAAVDIKSINKIKHNVTGVS